MDKSRVKSLKKRSVRYFFYFVPWIFFFFSVNFKDVRDFLSDLPIGIFFVIILLLTGRESKKTEMIHKFLTEQCIYSFG